MRKCGIFLVLSLGAALLGGCGGNVSTAKGVVDSLAKGDFTNPRERFDSNMKQALTPQMLREQWMFVTHTYGPLKSQGAARTEQQEDAGVRYEVVIIPCRFEKGALEARVVFNGNKEIAGLFFQPRGMPRGGK